MRHRGAGLGLFAVVVAGCGHQAIERPAAVAATGPASPVANAAPAAVSTAAPWWATGADQAGAAATTLPAAPPVTSYVPPAVEVPSPPPLVIPQVSPLTVTLPTPAGPDPWQVRQDCGQLAEDAFPNPLPDSITGQAPESSADQINDVIQLESQRAAFVQDCIQQRS